MKQVERAAVVAACKYVDAVMTDTLNECHKVHATA